MIYEDYEESKLLVTLDPELTDKEKADAITRLTSELVSTERALGIRWQPLGSIEVTATEDGSRELNTKGKE